LRLIINSLLLFAGFSVVSPAAFSQDTISAKPSEITYFNTLYSGGLIGKSGLGTTTTFSLINGIRFKSLSLGLGLGYDSYIKKYNDFTGEPGTRWKVMPVFVSLASDIVNVKTNAVFMQLNTGFSKMWVGENTNSAFELTDIKGGLMVNPLIGYRIITDKYSLYFATGYKWQKNQYNYHTIWWSGLENTEVTETMERMILQIGIGIH